jgi:hypothetical protein
MKVRRNNGHIEEMTLEQLQAYGPLLSGMAVAIDHPDGSGREIWTRASHYSASDVVVGLDGSVAIVDV